MLKCVIIEDEKAGQVILTKKLQKYFPDITIEAIIDNEEEALEFLSSNSVDLVFLDMHIKNGTGLGIINALSSPTFECIFVTAYKEYGVDAINSGASYYLLKPFTNADFINGVKKALERIELKSKDTDKLFISKEKVIVSINLSDIIYLEADGSYTKIHTNDEVIVASKNIGQFEDYLKSSRFLRVHHSYIINYDAIKEIIKSKNGVILLKNGAKIPISQRRMTHVLNTIEML